MASGVVNIACTNPELDCDNAYGVPLKMTINWKCTGGGSLERYLAYEYSASLLSHFGTFAHQPTKFKGYINRVVTRPNYSATPTNDYDITLREAVSTSDASGIDLLGGNGANRSNATQQAIQYSSDTRVEKELYLTIYNAGATKQGTIDIYMSGK